MDYFVSFRRAKKEETPKMCSEEKTCKHLSLKVLGFFTMHFRFPCFADDKNHWQRIPAFSEGLGLAKMFDYIFCGR